MKFFFPVIATALVLGSPLLADTKQAAAVQPSAQTPASPVDPAKAVEIKKLLAAADLVNSNVEAAKKSIAGMKKNSPGLDEKFWEDLEKVATHKAFEDILVSVYDQTYSTEEIKGITKFYLSTSGKAFLKKNNHALLEGGKAFQAFMEARSKSLVAQRNAAKAAAGKKN